jgi:uncharacterized protein (DUF1015 family)
MAHVHPFRAYRYNSATADFARVLTQPYDKITPAMQEAYYSAAPHNLIAIEKGREFPADSPADNVYTRAAASLRAWIAQGVLVQDSAPVFYAYFQEYTVPGTQEKRMRTGFIGLGTLEDYEAGVILRHERTHAGPKADRLELLRQTNLNTGQLFMLYADPQRRIDNILQEVAAAKPVTDVLDEFGVSHRLWPVSDSVPIAEIQRVMEQQKLVIADGHHRYETALNYRNEQRARAGSISRDAPYERAMMTFVNANAEGLTVLPTHRILSSPGKFASNEMEALRKALSPYFNWSVFPFEDGKERLQAYDLFRSQFESKRHARERTIGIYAGCLPSSEPGFHLITLRTDSSLAAMLPGDSPLQRELDVVLLHNFVLKKVLEIAPQGASAVQNIAYEREMEATVAAVDRGEAQLAFLLHPVTVEQVMRIASAGEVMPQKSTDFYPKMLSGITIYSLDA